MTLFTISCPTCQARLSVRRASAIGQILECPQCQSFVEVRPPAGWAPGLATPGADPISQIATPTVKGQPDSPDGPARPRSATEENLLASEHPREPGQPRWPWSTRLLGGALVVASLTMLAVGVRWWGSPPAGSVATVSRGILPATHGPAESSTLPTTEVEEPDARTTGPVGASESLKSRESPDVAPGPEPSSPAETTEPTNPTKIAPSDTATSGIDPGLNPIGTDSPGVLHEDTAADETADEASPSSSEGTVDSSLEPVTAVDTIATAAENGDSSIAAPSLPLPEETVADVAARLADPIAQLELPAASLPKFLAFFERASTIPLSVDFSVLSGTEQSWSTPIDISARDSTMGQVLSAALRRRGLVAIERGRGLSITAPDATDRDLRSDRQLPLGSLAEIDPQLVQEALRSVLKLVDHESGEEAVTLDGPNVALRTTAAGHALAAELVHAWQAARRVRAAGGARRWRAATLALATPVTSSFFRPAPLAEVLAHLARATGIWLAVNHESLDRAGLSVAVPVQLSVDQAPLETALKQLLEPLGLTFRAIDERTLEVTVPRALPFEAACFSLDATRVEPQAALADLMQSVHPEIWSDRPPRAQCWTDPAAGLVCVVGDAWLLRAVSEKLTAPVAAGARPTNR